MKQLQIIRKELNYTFVLIKTVKRLKQQGYLAGLD